MSLNDGVVRKWKQLCTVINDGGKNNDNDNNNNSNNNDMRRNNNDIENPKR
jgi:hypothetical protein